MASDSQGQVTDGSTCRNSSTVGPNNEISFCQGLEVSAYRYLRNFKPLRQLSDRCPTNPIDMLNDLLTPLLEEKISCFVRHFGLRSLSVDGVLPSVYHNPKAVSSENFTSWTDMDRLLWVLTESVWLHEWLV